jgi:cysteine-rich repeat protein
MRNPVTIVRRSLARGRRASLLVLFASLLGVLAACGDNLAGDEVCDLAGDEDGDGAADCDDPDCAGAAACQPMCGDGVVEGDEACDDGNDDDTDTCTRACAVARCGDGFVHAGVEACDDGNAVDTDACTSACEAARCGDGFVGPGEACDDGNQVNTDACTNACEAARCGDGIVGPGEACDDGNQVNTDACTSACALPTCGDGFMQAGEQCDDGNMENTDACLNSCMTATCGDGFIRAGAEQCDDMNMSNTDACLNTCMTATCGDGFTRAGVEQCDDGNMLNTDACLNSCASATCGDGFVRAGVEECDDGNLVNDDGCTNACVLDQIQVARNTADGSGLTLPIEGVYVTYLKPAIGNDPAGFTVQDVMTGPALFIAVDPASLTPAPVIGDEVSFVITTMASSGTLRQATAIMGFTRLAQGFNVNALVQNVSAANDLTTMIGSYESELIDVTGTLAGAFTGAGSMFEEIQLQTAGLPNDANLRVRMPTTLRDALDVTAGCTIALDNTPVGRFTTRVQLAAFTAGDLTLSSCPAPTVVSAIATSPNTVLVTFSRRIMPGSVLADGSQFMFDMGLTPTAAVVSGRTVTVTTSPQSQIATYTVTVLDSVRDQQGTMLGMPNSAMFPGFLAPAVVRINEVNAFVNGTTSPTCDLIELRVVSGGTMLNFRLTERTGGSGELNHTFPAVVVPTNAIVVVHLVSGNATCNPGTATAETTGPMEQPMATFGRNYDTAYDFWNADTGLTSTDNVITLYGPTGMIMDAVFLTDDAARATCAAATETAAAAVAAANQWQNVGGGQPALGYLDLDFNANAALDLNDATSNTITGTSIQRIDDTDDNDKADWNDAATVRPNTFGLLNVGQTPF